MSNETYPLFVYGTSRKGLWNHDRLNGARHIIDAALYGFRLYSWSSDAAVAIARRTDVVGIGGVVWGELYEVDPSDILRIDDFEKAHRHYGVYRRELVRVSLDDASKAEIDAWAYVGPDLDENTIPWVDIELGSMDFVSHLLRNGVATLCPQ